MTASARILQATRQDAPKQLPWQEEAWMMRDLVGELRFAEMWLSNAFSRSRLFAARRPAPGEEPQPVETGPAYDLIARLAGGVGGQSALLRAFGSYLLVPGAAYMVGEPKESAERYQVVDADDLRLGQHVDPGTGERGYDLREEEGVGGWRPLAPGTIVTKVHRPHPKRRWEPDSPTRAALTILKELVLLTQHVEASALSRLAGAGVQAWPSEMELPGGWDKFMDEYMKAVIKPSKDRSLAAALVPFPVRMPAAVIAAWKDGLMTYATPFDEKSIELREEAITRLGNAMDMPRQVLTGEQRNHWGDWQTEESGLKLHVEPGLETICEGFTTGFLVPGLSAGREIYPAIDSDLAAVEAETPEGEWIVWYDTSDLRVRPDRSEAIVSAYDRFEANGDDLRKEQGGSEWTPANPEDEETQRRVWFQMLNNPAMAPLALKKLGMVDDSELDELRPQEQPSGFGNRPGGVDDVSEPPDPSERALPRREPPSTPPDPSPPRREAADLTVDGLEGLDDVVVPDHPPVITPGIAIVAGLDGIVHRALERAGRRALNKLPRENGRLPRTVGGVECTAERLHTCTKIDRLLPVDRLLEDAWVRVPEVAERLNEDADALVATCDAYARMLIVTQTEHSWDSLSRALGVCAPCESEATVDAEAKPEA